MWPWNHLLLGYVLYSGYARVRHGRAPTGRAVVVLAFATQLPDLVDKPLAWIVGVLPSGLSLAHSLLVALPVVVAVVLISTRTGNADGGEAFAVGYLSHLLGDVLYPLAVRGEPAIGFLFWPIVPRSGGEPPGLLPKIGDLWSTYVAFLSTPRGSTYALLQAGLLALVLALWLRDGRPGPAALRRVLPGGPAADEREVG